MNRIALRERPGAHAAVSNDSSFCPPTELTLNTSSAASLLNSFFTINSAFALLPYPPRASS